MKALVNKFKVLAVPLFKDNYSYVVLGTGKNQAVLVDPANPTVVLEYLHKYLPSYQINCLLYTHKHWDHAGGSEQLVKELQNQKLLVVAGKEDGESIKGSNLLVQGDREIQVNNSRVMVYNVPCHTRGHILYHFHGRDADGEVPNFTEKTFTSENKEVYEFQSKECIFTGDTLFSAGVGRFFEGNAADMLGNFKKLSALDNHIEIFNGHEYTLSNLEWAVKVQPDNKEMMEYYQYSQNNKCTLPSTLGKQKQVNIFLRVLNPSPTLSKISQDPQQLLKTLRQMKNDNVTAIPSL